MLTIFTIPKHFRGHIAIIQRNAVTSWTLLHPKPEIILFGDEEGTAEICQELRLRHVPEVVRNEYGTPLLNDMFEKAQQLAGCDLLCLVNADIILMNDFMQAIEQVSQWRKRFLMVGQRCDLDVQEPWDFSRHDWEEHLQALAKRVGKQRPPTAIDYHAFPKGLFTAIPPFAKGRTTYDQWLIWYTTHLGATVVDATPRVLAIHQNHDYSHLPKGEHGVRKDEEAQWNRKLSEVSGKRREHPAYHTEEARRNRELSGGWTHQHTIAHASYILTPTGIQKAWGRDYFAARLELWRRQLIDWTRPLRHLIGLRQETRNA